MISRMSLLLTLSLVSVAYGDKPQQATKKQRPVLPAGVVVDADIIYEQTDDGPLKLDVYRPQSFDGPLPTIVFVHGGGWKGGSRASARRTAAWIVPDGYAVVSIDYRLTNVAQWPAQMNDCYAAVRWVRTHAAKYGFASEKIGVWGTSAGGHLVALMGTRPYPGSETTSSRVQAVCNWFGPADLLTMPPNTVSATRTMEQVAKSNGAMLLGAAVPTIPGRAKDASALHNVSSDDAPMLLMHGTEDAGVPISQSERLAAALVKVGVPSVLHRVEGAGHGGKEFFTEESKAVVRQFFARHIRR